MRATGTTATVAAMDHSYIEREGRIIADCIEG
jgi:hypothetical protein